MTKDPKIVALMIGRGGSTLKDKNILPVLGKPLLQHSGLAAKDSQFIGRYYISSDCDKILQVAEEIGYSKIKRPEYLSTPSSQSVDVVNHALELIEKDGIVDILIVQHANVGTITTKIFDDCVNLLLSDKTLSAVVPMHEKNEYHPYRCKTYSDDGCVYPFFDFSKTKVSGNRQELPPALFFDHSIWVLSVVNGVKSNIGQPPWTCMGNKIKPYITEGCFDVHEEEDLIRTANWIINNNLKLRNGE
jgi:CMP-N-acetylneuraminic acid synthetase